MIRQYRSEDAATCSTVIRDCLAHDPSMEPHLRSYMLSLESQDAMNERALLYYLAVFESEGTVVGVGGVEMNEIRLLYVSPGSQRAGIGSSLLHYLEDMVPPALFSDVFVYSAVSAAGFYLAHGYRPGGTHNVEVGPALYLPTVFMRKPIKARYD